MNDMGVLPWFKSIGKLKKRENFVLFSYPYDSLRLQKNLMPPLLFSLTAPS